MSIANADCTKTTTETLGRAMTIRCGNSEGRLYKDAGNVYCHQVDGSLIRNHQLVTDIKLEQRSSNQQNGHTIISQVNGECEEFSEKAIISKKEKKYVGTEWEPVNSGETQDKVAEAIDCSFQKSLCLEEIPQKDDGSQIFTDSGLTRRKPHRRKRFRYGITRRKEPAKAVRKSQDSAVKRSSFHRPNFINTVVLGNYEMDTWFWSPYPNECVLSGTVYICEKCLELKRSAETLQSHIVRCKALYPPGDEIFRQENISVFEVDGEKAKVYCQHLCMLGKLFIDHKALFYDVEPFLFYVATLWNSSGLHLVGYFSKQKHSEEKHNLSCIVTLPCYQERGYGRFLIDFSFLLTRREKILGSAEKPLSDLGLIAYRSYWRTAILEFLYLKKERDGTFCQLSVDEIARATGIEHEDVLQTLNGLEMLSVDNDSVFLKINFTAVRSHWEEAKKDPRRIWIDETNLKWKPKL